MRIPLLSGYQELDPAPRRFLMYVAINVVSWQNIIGPAAILFARKIDMPESLVGLMLSFMPFTTLLLLVTVPMIIRFGPKRVMMTAWMLRNVIACVVFLMPLALATGDKRLAWAVLLLATLGFCVMRALGSGGWLPWLHEIVSEEKRSVYFSTETAIMQVINVAVLFAQARLLAVDDPSVARFLLIYAIGIIMGFISLLWMRRIPGGEGVINVAPMSIRRAYAHAAADRSFMVFLLVSSLSMSSMVWFGAAYVMYMRDIMAVRDSMTMTMAAVGSLGIFLTVGSWARFTEKNGSGLAMAKTMFGHVLAPALFLLPGMGIGASPYMALPPVLFACVFGASFHVAANRAMLNQVPDHDRVGYTALWTMCTALALGATPLAAGLIIERFGLWGFRLCFITSIVTGLLSALMCLILIHDKNMYGRVRTSMFNPAVPLRTMARIIWITIGLDESNRTD